MKKRLAFVLVFALCAALLCIGAGATDSDFAGGDGTESDPYQISTPEQLAQLAANVNGGNDYNGKYFILTQDIDISSYTSWVTIGNTNVHFKGTFDGVGHTIKINITNADLYRGLFGYVDASGTVKRLGVTGNMSCDARSGGIAAYNHGRIEYCYSNVDIQSVGDYTAGIAGTNGGKISYCYNAGDIDSLGSAAGIADDNGNGEIEHCYNFGNISSNSGSFAIASNGTVSTSYYLSGSAVDAGGGTSISPTDFTNSGSFSGWDFGNTWKMSDFLGRPVLRDNNEAGYGTEDKPYKIDNLYKLSRMASLVNDDNKQGEYAGKCYLLTADIDMSDTYHSGDGGKSWTPIGTESTPFTGTFDGGNHTISGLYISTKSNSPQGLLGQLSGGTVKNLNVSGNVTGVSNVGGVVGYASNHTTIENCSFSGSVSGSNTPVGGVAGLLFDNSSVLNCHNSGSVSSNFIPGGTDNTSLASTGGLIGSSYGTVTNCYNTGSINVTVEETVGTQPVEVTVRIGGVVGSNSGTIRNCHSTGNISYTDKNQNVTIYTGGITGVNSGNITNCYYLNTSCTNPGGGTSKTSDEFASGEVAWLLQNGQTPVGDVKPQVWGQTLGEGRDAYPVLTSDASLSVIKASFVYDLNGDGTEKEVGALYTNHGGSVKMPETFEGIPSGYHVANWTCDQFPSIVYTPNYSVSGLTSDCTFTANLELAAPVITTGGSLPSATVGVQYSQTLSATAAKEVTVRWSAIGLPNGLKIDSSTGEISGAPTASGTFNFTVTASIEDGGDSKLSGSKTFSLVVNKGTPDITITSGSGAYTYGDTITVSGTIAASSTASGSNSLAAPAPNQVALFLGDAQLTELVDVVGGAFSISYVTAGQKIPIGNQTLTVKYGGSGDLNDGETTVSITLNRKPVTAAFTGPTTKVYDGNTSAPDGLTVGLNTGGVVGYDDVALSNTGIAYDSAVPGSGKNITASGLSLIGDDSKWYTLSIDTATTTGMITQAAQVAPDAPTLAYSTTTGITLTAIPASSVSGAAAEYSMDGGTTWQTSPVFTGMRPSTEYTFVARYGETELYNASPASASAVFRTASGNIPDPTYKPIIDAPEGVEVTTDPARPKPGDTVTVTTEPDGTVTVTDKDGNPVDVTRNPDGTWTYIQPEGAVKITVTPGAPELPFTDVPSGAWYYDAISYVYANGLMDGVSGTQFNPDGNMTRAMVWAILARMDGETVTGANWIETARAWAMAEGVSDGTDPTGLVTREQLATMLWRYAGEPASEYDLAAFTDASSVSAWALDAMRWAVENGIVTGVTATTLEPQGTATRAQCAAILMRYIVNI